MLRVWHLPVPLLALLIPILCAPMERRTSAYSPAIPQDFPDPSIINTLGSWYAFATQSGNTHVQIAKSPDFNSWNVLGKDALPTLPSWVNPASPGIWAPDVIERVSRQRPHIPQHHAAPQPKPSNNTHFFRTTVPTSSISPPPSPLIPPTTASAPQSQIPASKDPIPLSHSR
jgi:hypothetical protein